MESAKDESAKTEITLKGSVAIVSDFFFTAINSILYQRGA
jgi:mitotic spindle assembly checkpoint protein MAD2